MTVIRHLELGQLEHEGLGISNPITNYIQTAYGIARRPYGMQNVHERIADVATVTMCGGVDSDENADDNCWTRRHTTALTTPRSSDESEVVAPS